MTGGLYSLVGSTSAASKAKSSSTVSTPPTCSGLLLNAPDAVQTSSSTRVSARDVLPTAMPVTVFECVSIRESVSAKAWPTHTSLSRATSAEGPSSTKIRATCLVDRSMRDTVRPSWFATQTSVSVTASAEGPASTTMSSCCRSLVCVLSSVTVPLRALVTQSVEPSSASADGPSPTGIALSAFPVFTSIR